MFLPTGKLAVQHSPPLIIAVPLLFVLSKAMTKGPPQNRWTKTNKKARSIGGQFSF
jgi:hypothetical protein